VNITFIVYNVIIYSSPCYLFHGRYKWFSLKEKFLSHHFFLNFQSIIILYLFILFFFSTNFGSYNAPKKLSNFIKGKAPMAQDNEDYILYLAGYPEHKIRRIHSRKSYSGSHHAFMYKNETSSYRHSTHVKMPKKKTPVASNESNISFKTFVASYVLTNKSGKVVAKYVGGKHKGSKTCVWVPKNKA
jgi:hypothetical protein